MNYNNSGGSLKFSLDGKNGKLFYSTLNTISAHVNTEGNEKNDEMSKIGINTNRSLMGSKLSPLNLTSIRFNTSLNSFKNTTKNSVDFGYKTPKARELTEKDILIRPTITDELKDRIDERKNEESHVKNLEMWDLKNLTNYKFHKVDPENEKFIKNIQKGKKSRSSLVTDFLKINPESEILKNQAFMSLSQNDQIRESLSNVRLNHFSPYLKDFNKKKDQEQGAILLQNINITKRSFNFDVIKRDVSEVPNENKINKIENTLLNSSTKGKFKSVISKKNLDRILEIREGEDHIEEFSQEEEIIENEFIQVGHGIRLKPKNTLLYKCPNGCFEICKCKEKKTVSLLHLK
jgi:hypothetical protein